MPKTDDVNAARVGGPGAPRMPDLNFVALFFDEEGETAFFSFFFREEKEQLLQRRRLAIVGSPYTLSSGRSPI